MSLAPLEGAAPVTDIKPDDEVYWQDDQPWTVKAARDGSAIVERVETRIARHLVPADLLRPDWPFGKPPSTADL